MTAIINSNQPASPTPKYPHTGLTKREAFTMAAIQGLCSNMTQVDNASYRISVCVADMAIQIADAALTKLAQSTGDE